MSVKHSKKGKGSKGHKRHKKHKKNFWGTVGKGISQVYKDAKHGISEAGKVVKETIKETGQTARAAVEAPAKAFGAGTSGFGGIGLGVLLAAGLGALFVFSRRG